MEAHKILMAITTAGRALLKRMELAESFGPLIQRDPTADQGIDPWDGQNPRDLTESAIRFRLAQEGASLNADDARIEEQCRRHLHGW